MQESRTVILGGGPAGCGAAYQLRRHGHGAVTLVERRPVVAGNAGSFRWAGQYLDYGSHRLHAACDPEILADIRAMLGDDLRDRRRHGRIRLRGRWIHFPIQKVDVLLRLDKRFALGIVSDMVRRTLFRTADDGDSFASVLWANLGPTICRHFYFPYARKIWGREPEELSAIQARKRVSAGSFSKLLERLVRAPGGGRFYYPRRGYGQITEAYAERASELGAELLLGWTVTGLERPPSAGGRWGVRAERNGETRELVAERVWSTIPLTLAVRMMTPAPPPEVLAASAEIDYRAMVLVYLELPLQRFTSTDAHYFPEAEIRMTRLSEPKNYFGLDEPSGSTVLCAELPCDPADPIWTMSDEELGRLVVADLERAELPVPEPPTDVTVRRIRQAYPIYLRGYEAPFDTLDEWIGSLPGFLSYGRQGLFAHDNTHHALFMAYAAVSCMRDGGFDTDRWAELRRVFETHVVED